jgi:hypothetical protein
LEEEVETTSTDQTVDQIKEIQILW